MEFADRLREFAARVKIVPEYTVDVGIKKGEKVDYAIIDKKQNPVILIEANTAAMTSRIKWIKNRSWW